MTVIYNPILNNTLAKMYSIYTIAYYVSRVFHEFAGTLSRILDVNWCKGSVGV